MKHKGVIWTKHILERMKQRHLTYDDVYWAFHKPDKSFPASSKGGWKFYRTYNGVLISVVASKNEQSEWVMMTCWSKEVDQRQQKHPKSKGKSFLQGMWEMFVK